MTEIRVKIERAIQLFVDNKSAINLASNPVSHGRSKHIRARFHFLEGASQPWKDEVDLLSYTATNG